MSDDLEEKCSRYAHQIVKPMMSYFDQMNKKSVKFDAEMDSKTQEIKQLQEKVTKLQIENTIYKTKEDSMAAVLEELKNQKIAIVQQYQWEKENNQINELKEQIKSNSKRLIEYEENLSSIKKVIHEKDIRILQLESENQNQIIKLKESELKNEQKNMEIFELNANISISLDKANKCDTEYTNQKAINSANEQKIREMETQVNISDTKLKAMQTNKNAMSCIDRAYTFKGQCNSDIAGLGWTVIQQRINGGVDFTRNWTEYKNGFGDFWDGDFFLGLEKIHRLTSEKPCELYIHLENFDGSTQFARYAEFAITGEEDNYRLSTLGTFSGRKDELKFNKNMPFSTYERDNDNFSENCATKYHGGTGWWYNCCTTW